MRENRTFKCEHLLEAGNFEHLLSSFTLKRGYGLEAYLKEQAIGNEIRHYDNTYLVTYKETGELAAYFSLKAGMVSLEERKFLYKVREAVPGVELSNFAANDAFKEKHKDVKNLGIIVFVDFIRPILKEVAELIGARHIYIYALPEEKLINYYSKLGFVRLEKPYERDLHHRIKPSYDRGCIFMFQNIFE